MSILFINICVERRKFRLALYAQLAVTIIPGIVTACIGLTTCAGAVAWINGNNSCGTLVDLFRLSAAWTMIEATTDLCMSFLAVYLMFDVQGVTLLNRLVSCFLLLFSTSGSIVGYIRAYLAFVALRHPTIAHSTILAVFSVIDAGVCILSIALVTIRPLLSRLRELKYSCRRAEESRITDENNVSHLWSPGNKLSDEEDKSFNLVRLQVRELPPRGLGQPPAPQGHETHIDSWDPRYKSEVTNQGIPGEAVSRHACNRVLQSYGLI